MELRINYWISCAYAIICAFAISALAVSCQQVPIVLKIENAIYDPLQELWAIDHADDWRVHRFQSELDAYYSITLDSVLIDWECNRVKRDLLAQLLDSLRIQAPDNIIFLDYIFEPLDTTETGTLRGKDYRLYQSMLALGDRLFFLKEKDARAIFPREGLLVSQPSNNSSSPPQIGVLNIQQDTLETVVRYVSLDREENQGKSIIELLPLREQANSSVALRDFEINYLIRGNRPKAYRHILRGDLASAILERGLSKDHFSVGTNNKMIIVGAFDKLVNKYGLIFDSFETPIDKQLSGVYVNLNAFLNLQTGSYIRRASWFLVFHLNILTVLSGILYFHKTQIKDKKYFVKPNHLLVGEVIGVVILCLGLVIGLFYWYYIKFPFIGTLLFLPFHQRLYKRIVIKDKIKKS